VLIWLLFTAPTNTEDLQGLPDGVTGLLQILDLGKGNNLKEAPQIGTEGIEKMWADLILGPSWI